MGASRAAFRIAQEVADRYAELPQVEAVALGGSLAIGRFDEESDIDLYVYVHKEPPLAARAEIAKSRGERAELDSRLWEPGDQWHERDGTAKVDVTFRDLGWMEDEIERRLRRHEACLGYTTCLWHSVRAARASFDRAGWFAGLQERAAQPYPEGLRRAIVAKNHAALRTQGSSYLDQLRVAVARHDRVSVNHRVAALLASYFDILFAVNRLTHPGEKRLLERASVECSRRPPEMEDRIQALLSAAASPSHTVLDAADTLVAGLDGLIAEEGLSDIVSLPPRA